MLRYSSLILLLLFAAVAQADQSSGSIIGASATCTPNVCVSLALPNGTQSVNVTLSGSFVATVTMEESADHGANWFMLTTINATGLTGLSVSGMTDIRARGSAYTSGTISVTLMSSTSTLPQQQSGTVTLNNFPVASGPVTVSNWPNSQHVVCDSGCAGGGSVAVSNFPATQPVSGTFFQATQPVSLLSVPTHAVSQSGAWSVSVSNFPATQAVSAASLPLPTGASTAAKQPALGVAGTPSADVLSVQGVVGGIAQPVSGSVSVSNFPATQPISGSVSVSNFPATQAVTGTFFQATQPVSLAALPVGHVIVDTAPTTAVTGQFFQATQPVSGAVSVSNFPATQPVSIAAMPTTPVTGAFFQSTQPVSLTTLPALTAGSAVIGHVINDASAAVIGQVNQAPTIAAAQAVIPKTIAALSVQNLKATAGNVYGVALQNPNASVCWLQFYNTASSPVLGTSVIWALPVPTSGTLLMPPADLAMANHTTGIGVGSATTATGATACGTALAGTVFIF